MADTLAKIGEALRRAPKGAAMKPIYASVAAECGLSARHIGKLAVKHHAGLIAALKPATDSERFWAKVSVGGPGDCWPWTAGKYHFGHGCFWTNGRAITASRFAYEDRIGQIPEGLWVLHRCDNPSCCNPAHFFLGSAADNTADMDRKGRRKVMRGEAQPGAKLTEEEVREIKRRIAAGRQSYASIARDFGVCSTRVSFIKAGTNWGHVEP